MPTKLDTSKYIIAPGDPAHIHHEIVSKESDGLIGRCACGLIKNYTLLHDQLLEMRDGYIRPFTMDNIMKSRIGGKKGKGKSKKAVNT